LNDVDVPIEIKTYFRRATAVFDLMRSMPGTPFIASSIGRVTETRVCDAGASPLSTMMTMRWKSVCGKDHNWKLPRGVQTRRAKQRDDN
jgi:hypothetical protein